jgi:hypothetical protein
MATKNYTDIDQLPISLNITVRELKVIDRLMTEHGAEWNGWSSERQLHKDIRQILAEAFKSMQHDSKYDVDKFNSVVEYTIKKEESIDA